MNGYRGRFAPSPTGLLHLGSARTALVAWARARAANGALVLRVEDLDTPRVVPGAEAQLLDDLRWLGLDWDEGPDVGGPHAPYVQSARRAGYDAAIETLGDAVYPCTCSRREIAQVASAPHGLDSEGPVYPGTCRNGLTHPERPAALRFRMPEVPDGFRDLLCGDVPAGLGAGDFVVRRADGVHSYQLAVVVDDRDMRITEVVRGDDLLSSTPRQRALFAALGATPPQYLHVPLVLGDDGERLAKRHPKTSVRALREEGLCAEEVVGKLAASLGWARAGESLTARDVVPRVALDAVPRAPWRVSR